MRHYLVPAILCATVAAPALAHQRQPPLSPDPRCGSSRPGSLPCPPALRPSELPASIIARPSQPSPAEPVAPPPAGKAEIDRSWRFECNPILCDPPKRHAGEGSPGRDDTPGGNGGGIEGSNSGGNGENGGAGGIEGGRHNTSEPSANRWMVFVYPEPKCGVVVAKTLDQAEVQARNKGLPPPSHLLGYITQKGAASAWCVTTPGKARRYFFVQGQQPGLPAKENAISQSRENARRYMAENPGSQLVWIYSSTFG
jgi:hypothetical protein